MRVEWPLAEAGVVWRVDFFLPLTPSQPADVSYEYLLEVLEADAYTLELRSLHPESSSSMGHMVLS